MFDKTAFEVMPKYENFTYWFIRTDKSLFDIIKKDDPGEVLESFVDDGTSRCPSNIIGVADDFDLFKQRPEYFVGQEAKLNTQMISFNTSDDLIDSFENLIVGASFIRARNAGLDPDKSFESVDRFLYWIRGTDFYSCPASTRFHDAEPLGLLYHSLNVYNNMIDLRNLEKFNHVDYHSMVLTSLCHDFTKIGNYEMYMRNVKNDQTGQWEQVPSYRWKGNPFPFGHGVASMYIVSQFFKLSMEESLAIRWHMGEYSVSPREGGELEDAGEQYPLVKMLQFADQLACVKY